MKNSLIFIVLFFSSIIGNENKPKLEIKLNTAHVSTKSEWTPFRNNYEISIAEFWQLVGDKGRSEYWKRYQRTKLFIDNKWTTLSLGLIGWSLISVATTEEEEKIYTNTGLSFSVISIVTFMYDASLKNKYDPISYIEAKEIVEKYNTQ